jgi:alkaline phosphatase
MNRYRHRTASLLAAFVLAALCVGAQTASRQEDARVAKYVFLMIGDGMGSAQRTLGELALNAADENAAPPATTKRLVMNQFPVHGMTVTASADSWITDSAAAGTALACGHKTRNGVIGMDEHGGVAFPSLGELAKKAGRKVGIVSSVSIDHATPACFLSHNPSRKNYRDIAAACLESGADYIGGGQVIGMPDGRDKTSLRGLAGKHGWRTATTRGELNALRPGTKVWAFNHTVDDSAALYYDIDRPEDHIALHEFTAKGIELLDNPNGFFMMVEGGRIDWACHANDAAAAAREMLAFDQAVAAAYEFYKRHPQDTLIVVTGDHECGGLTIGTARTGYKVYPGRLSRQTLSHAAFEDTVAAWHREPVGFFEALPAIRKAFGFREADLEPHDIQRLAAAFEKSISGQKPDANDLQQALIYGGKDPLTVTCTALVAEQAGIGWTSFAHTGVPVQTSAVGVGQERFGGYHDNTDIFRHIVAAMGLTNTVAAR